MSLTFLLIGDESLTCECGEEALARGHWIAAVVTRAARVRIWAVARGLPLAAMEAVPEVDWILSVANTRILPPEVLARARRGAVNFHDGPLPEHAGLNAPAWALWEGEAEHAISWHLIEGGVDAGRLLLEKRFPIAPEETSHSLNTRCLAAGMETFPAVLAQMQHGPIAFAQRPAPRRRHRRADRPPAMGLLDLSAPAEVVARRVRALDHGATWNPLCTAKIRTEEGVFNLIRADACAGTGVPGELLARDAEGVTVACGSGAVRLSGFTCQRKGEAVAAGAIRGARLLMPDAEEVSRLDAAQAAVAVEEEALRQALHALEPVAVPESVEAAVPDWQSLPLAGEIAALTLATLRACGRRAGDIALAARALPGLLAGWRPLRLDLSGPLAPMIARLEEEITAALERPGFGWPLDLMTRDPALRGLTVPPLALARAGPLEGSVVTLTPGALHFDAARLAPEAAARLHARILHIAGVIARCPPEEAAALPGLTEAERRAVLAATHGPVRAFDPEATVQGAFLAAARRHPEAVALVFGGEEWSYARLEARARGLAGQLMARDVRRGDIVGLCTPRGPEMVAGALAILMAGAAYLPMDPAYPAARLAHFVEDSGCRLILCTEETAAVLPGPVPRLVAAAGEEPPGPLTLPEGTGADLAYLIYTSGSTGRPKGVMVRHRNLTNFFAGMDECLGAGRGTWLAVTSLSFDISVLELLWTLTRGFKVVIAPDQRLLAPGVARGRCPGRRMDLSLFFWGNDGGAGAEKYRLLLEAAQFADRHGFTAIWTPERHFHAFGGPYPNPAVTGAAVAAVTRNLAVRAGSCVLPLHHPARVAEEWAVIDNLTNGRAGIAVASGWQPEDFLLRPENAPPRHKAALLQAVEELRRLWRGEAVAFPLPEGGVARILTQPRPVSPELPLWLTTAGNPETWREAGAMGAHVLTHLLGQSLEEVAEKIRLYRAARAEAGHPPETGKVTLMLHCLLGESRDQVRAAAEPALKDYLAASLGLVRHYAWAFPAFRRPDGAPEAEIDLATLDEGSRTAVLDFAFRRYFEESGFFGSVEEALERVDRLAEAGVDEIASLIDFGLPREAVMQGLVPLAQVVAQLRARQGGGRHGGGPQHGAEEDQSLAALIRRHGVTHLQCTPTLARMLLEEEESRAALGALRVMLVGGEALPPALARQLRAATSARLFNMYGPTETTIWSSFAEIGVTEGIGRPLANQSLYVLDERLAPVPPGQVGELWIGGEGVTPGYWRQDEMTAERFIPNPFGPGRLYRSGDQARLRPDGAFECLGRIDQQIKLRGHRIEPGEIEAAMTEVEGVAQAAVILAADAGGAPALIGFYSGRCEAAALRAALAARLPEPARPARLLRLAALPLTPNGKIDRKALPALVAAEEDSPPPPPAPEGVEGEIAALWQRLLGQARIGTRDNFFALGGHSLLALQMHRALRERFPGAELSIADVFRYPVLADLAAHLRALTGEAPGPAPASASAAPPGRELDDLAAAIARRRAMRMARRGHHG